MCPFFFDGAISHEKHQIGLVGDPAPAGSNLDFTKTEKAQARTDD